MSKINYDLTKIRGIAFDIDGVLSPTTVPMAADGTPSRMVNVRDGYAIQLAVRQGLNLAIISGANSPALIDRYTSLGIPKDDIELAAGKKIDCLNSWMKRRGLSSEEVAYVGDDVPDTDALAAVGLSVVPADADSEVKQIATYISPVIGGYGVGRDLLEQILKAKGLWLQCDVAFGWIKK